MLRKVHCREKSAPKSDQTVNQFVEICNADAIKISRIKKKNLEAPHVG